jgi:hypothetical protein
LGDAREPPPASLMTVGELAERTGISPKAIRDLKPSCQLGAARSESCHQSSQPYGAVRLETT